MARPVAKKTWADEEKNVRKHVKKVIYGPAKIGSLRFKWPAGGSGGGPAGRPRPARESHKRLPTVASC